MRRSSASGYLLHERERSEGKAVSGLLVYPQVGKDIHLSYELIGLPVTIATIDLSQKWRRIHQDLIGLLSAVATE